MRKLLTILSLLFLPIFINAQCFNADLENGDLSGWTGTWGDGICTNSIFGICITTGPDPYEFIGLNQGTNNQASTDGPEQNHFIMTGGNDAIVGAGPPVVFNGSYSMRLGNAQADDGGETISYSFVVDNTNSI